MTKRTGYLHTLLLTLALLLPQLLHAQIDVSRVMTIGRNALYFNDYVVSIGYFNQVIGSRSWMAEPYFYRAVAKVSLEDFSGAEADASLCIERNAFIPKAYLVRGVARQNQKKYDLAAEDYRTGLRQTPDDEGMRYNLAMTELLRDKFDDAQKELETMLKFSPGSLDAYLLLSAVALQQKDTVRSESYIDTILRRDSFFGPAYAVSSQIAYEKKEYKQSLKRINKAIELIDEDPALYINRGIIRYQLNDLRGAMDDYSHVLDISSNNKIALFNRALLRSYLGDKNNAISDLNHLIKLEPSNHIARFNRGLLLADIGKHSEAINDYNAVIKQYPEFINGWLARSQSRKLMGNAVGADRDYWHAVDLQEKAKKQKKTDKQPAKENSESKETRKEDDETIEKYNMLVVAEPEQETKAQYNSKVRGKVQDRNVEVEPRNIYVLTYYHRFDSEEINPNVPYSALVDRLNKQGILPFRLLLSNHEIPLDEEMVKRHQSDIEEATGTEKMSADNLFRRGLDYLLLQNHEQAISDFTSSLNLKPDQPLVLFARATALLKKQEAERNRMAAVTGENLSTQGKLILGESKKNAFGYNEAEHKANEARLKKPLTDLHTPVQDLDRTIQLNANFSYAYYNRAWIYAQQGETAKAIEDYTQAIALSPGLADAYFNRGLLYLAGGKSKEGLKDLSKAGELGLYQAYNILKRMNK